MASGRSVWHLFDGEKDVYRVDYPVDGVISENQQVRNEAGRAWSGDWHRVASIPLNVAHDSGLVQAHSEGNDAFLGQSRLAHERGQAMTISDYASLLVDAGEYSGRNDIAHLFPRFIGLAELKLNRALRVAGMEVVGTVTLIAGSGPLPTDFLEAREVKNANGIPIRA
eukprot:gene24339-24414_t